MALKDKFYTVNGQILGERSAGGALNRYLPDALGSVRMTLESGTHSAQSTYTPYGRGTAPLGATFGWAGVPGYRPSGLAQISHYVRAISYSDELGRRISPSGLSLQVPPYAYAAADAPDAWYTPLARSGPCTGKKCVGYASCFNLTKHVVKAKTCPNQTVDRTVYRIQGKPLWCNYEETNVACPSVGSQGDDGYYAAWPFIKGNYDHSEHYYCPHCKHKHVTRTCKHFGSSTEYQTVPQIKCGLQLTVTATNPKTSKTKSVTVVIIDNGPGAGTGDLIDLSQAAAKDLYDGIGVKWPGCDNFKTQDDHVEVTVTW